MRCLWGLLVVVIAGCVEPGSVTCGEFICAAGSRCMSVPGDGPPRCVTPDQVAACEGLQPFEACADEGRCYELVDGLACLEVGCGNGFTDPEEQCDDENNRSLDGCSADCRSNETCGNGVIDPLQSEQCDDANHLSHDGCSSNCRNEAAGWISVDTSDPLPFGQSALAVDARRGRFIMSGGTFFTPVVGGSTFPNPATWEWTGAAWSQHVSPISPLPRTHAAMAYDTARGVTVLFGGAGDLADTWEWNGTSWLQRDEIGPEGRSGAAMAYDARRERIVLVGGTSGNKELPATTWEWDGTVWTAVPNSVTNPNLGSPEIAYDSKRGVMVMMLLAPVPPGMEIYERTDAAWTRVRTTTEPVSAIAFDPVLEKIIAIDAPLTTFSWDGAIWKMLTTPSPSRVLAKLATDPVHRKVIGFSSDTFGLGGGIAGLFEWNGTAWSQPTSSGTFGPNPGAGAAAANDLQRHVSIVFGGDAGSGLTWTFDGHEWRQVAATGPGDRTDAALAFRTAGGTAILFGGLEGTQLRADTWRWNGASWSNAMLTGPSARRGHAMAYDAARDRIVLFGGSTDTGARELDVVTCACADASTWQFDGTSWSAMPAGSGPLARRDASMAYDPVRAQIVLFGGHRAGDLDAFANDTWTFDGAWHQQHPIASPPPRMGATLTWDASRKRLVLFGGFAIEVRDVGPTTLYRLVSLDDSWEWDGTRWRRLVTTTQPTGRGGHLATTSPDGAGIIVIGGTKSDGSLLEPLRDGAHAIRWVADSPTETCATRVDADGDGLAGCADPDCWPSCSPRCPPGTSCAAGARCGDGACDPLETRAICSIDCGAPTVTCGDLVCDSGESCAAECP